MIVQLVLKGLFLYFVFLVLRSLFRGASQVSQMKDFLKEAQNGRGQGRPGQGHPGQGRPKGSHQGRNNNSSSSNEDVVEAEFRRL